MNIQCPHCGDEYVEYVGPIPRPELFDKEFRQGCFFAFVAHCECNPHHIFTVIIGEHKGQIILETIKPK